MIAATRRPKTHEAYADATRRFELFLRRHGHDVQTAPPQSLQAFVLSMCEEHLSTATIHWRTAGIRRYLAWCAEREVRVTPMYTPTMPRLRETVAEVLRGPQLGQYMEVARTQPEPYATVLQLLPMSGLRRSEICQLRCQDLSLHPRVFLHIRSGKDTFVKSKRDRLVPPLMPAHRFLREYVLGPRRGIQSEWLFPHKNGNGHITPRMLGKKVKKIRERLGLQQKLTTHTLRHTFATLLKASGLSDSYIKGVMGHENLNTTARYIHPAIEEVSDAISAIDVSWLQ